MLVLMAMLMISCVENNERPQSIKRSTKAQKSKDFAELSMGKVLNSKALPIDQELIELINKEQLDLEEDELNKLAGLLEVTSITCENGQRVSISEAIKQKETVRCRFWRKWTAAAIRLLRQNHKPENIPQLLSTNDEFSEKEHNECLELRIAENDESLLKDIYSTLQELRDIPICVVPPASKKNVYTDSRWSNKKLRPLRIKLDLNNKNSTIGLSDIFEHVDEKKSDVSIKPHRSPISRWVVRGFAINARQKTASIIRYWDHKLFEEPGKRYQKR